MPEEEKQSNSASDREEFDALVVEHADFVYNVAYRMMGNPEDAEDVAQDAFLSAYRAYAASAERPAQRPGSIGSPSMRPS